ncbi:hypothetical protein ACU5EH_20170 [Aliivibrio salmonicida]|uniref:hypothetical protein n=1 Tax=Aliivibrio salmonicida TaxID=40269 RepID=UPI00406C7A72
MSITKEQWKHIEQALSDMVIDVRFEYKGFELSINRVRLGENKLALRVYIDDEMKDSWFLDALEDKDNEVSSIFKDVYKEKTKSRYAPSSIKRAEKALGKRGIKQHYPDIYEKDRYWLPDFNKGSVLCRQYKKLKGLALLRYC